MSHMNTALLLLEKSCHQNSTDKYVQNGNSFTALSTISNYDRIQIVLSFLCHVGIEDTVVSNNISFIQ